MKQVSSFFDFLGYSLEDQINKAIIEKIEEYQNYSKDIPQSFSPIKNLHVMYKITDMKWKDKTMMFKANAAISTTVDGEIENFMPNVTDSKLPVDWPMHSPMDKQSHLLQGLHISTEFLSRFV